MDYDNITYDRKKKSNKSKKDKDTYGKFSSKSIRNRVVPTTTLPETKPTNNNKK
jgi:hypothetical protein